MMKKPFWRYYKNKRLMAAIIIVVVIVLIFWLKSGSKNSSFESATVGIGNIIETVSVTGSILPVDKADLAFEKAGVVSRIDVKVGDLVKKGDPIASLFNADDAAAVRAAEAQLSELKRGLRPEEFAADQAAVDSASTSLANARKDAMNAVRDAYIKTQGAIVNYADRFFTNPQSVNPAINILTQTNTLQYRLNADRLVVRDSLVTWKNEIDNADYSSEEIITLAENHLNIIKNFLDSLSITVNNLNPSNSGLSQSAIDVDVAAINTGLSNLMQAMNAVTDADSALKNAVAVLTQANNQFNLQKVGSSADAIAVQAAKVLQARAVLDKDKIVSPIDGIVTRVNPAVGEFVAAGQTAFSVQNYDLKIEAYVPEADIAKVSIGNLASSTLDAYGSYVNFPTEVTMIDPAETVIDSVPTYKVTFRFLNTDSRIRSGMTANLEIMTHRIDRVLEIPYRAVVDDGSRKSVRLVNSNGKTYSSIPVKVGLKGSDGMIEIISGLKASDKVVTYVK